jgi:hypothetical protein
MGMDEKAVAGSQDRGAFRESEKTWEKSAPSQIMLNTIFTALSVVLIAFVVGDSLPRNLKYLENKYKFVELVLTVLSFFLFATSAEGTTNAYDEKDVRKHVYYLLIYNFGVIVLGFAIALFVGIHFFEQLVQLAHRVLSFLTEPAVCSSLVVGVYFFFFIVLLWHWIWDALWLLFSSNAKFGLYLKELTDEVVPEPEPSYLMKLFYWHRNI